MTFNEVMAKHFLICQYKVPALFHKALNYNDPFYLNSDSMQSDLSCLWQTGKKENALTLPSVLKKKNWSPGRCDE